MSGPTDPIPASRRTRLRLGALILLVSAPLHLVALDHPHGVVFDEVHFGQYVSAYCGSGERFFDIHPPHAKLAIAGTAKTLGGYDGRYPFLRIGADYAETPIFALRLVPALAGIAVSLLFFVLLGQLGASPAGAFLGGLLVTLDNGILIQTRIIALDGVLLAALLGSLCACLAARRARRTSARLLLFLLCGTLAGLAVGTKWTGLTALGLIGLLLLLDLARSRSPRTALRSIGSGVLVLTAALVVYGAGWALHWELLPKRGAGDAMHRPTGVYLDDTLSLHGRMFESNRQINATHPGASPWIAWPVMVKPISYWVGPDASIFFVGNAVVWVGSTIALLVLLAMSIAGLFHRGPGLRWSAGMGLALTGYLAAWLPHAPINRPLYLYHYLPPLLFVTAFVVLGFERAGWIRPGGLRQQSWLYALAIVATVVGFVVFAPLTYGIQVPDAYRRAVYSLLLG